MARVVRSSKFRHVFGTTQKRDQCYDNIRITKTTCDSNYCSVNLKYVAIISEAAGGGSFIVLPLEKTGRIDRDTFVVAGHKGPVLDIEFCPHNDDVIASASDDFTVKVWVIPEGGLTENLTEPFRDLIGHQKKVGLIKWHPTARNVLLSAGYDNKIIIWNVDAEEIQVMIDMPDVVCSASFNCNGSRLVTTCKDKMMRIIDPRNGAVLVEGKGHDSQKPSQVVYMHGGRILTTGFNKISRQYAVWSEDNLNTHLVLENIDENNGVLFPFYDPDTAMIFMCGKGDSALRYFEVVDEEPYIHYLSSHLSKDSGKGFCFMPKRGVDVNKCEVSRIFKLQTKGLCEPISFTVPRKSELFQDDLYPDADAEEAALTAEEWMCGKDRDPIKVSLKTKFKGTTLPGVSAAIRKGNALKKMPMPAKTSAILAQKPCDDEAAVTPIAKLKPPPVATPAPVVETPAHIAAILQRVEKPTPVFEAAPAPPAATPAHVETSACAHERGSENAAAAVAPPAVGNIAASEITAEEDDIGDVAALLEDLHLLKMTVKKHEKRITELEKKVADSERNVEDDEWA